MRRWMRFARNRTAGMGSETSRGTRGSIPHPIAIILAAVAIAIPHVAFAEADGPKGTGEFNHPDHGSLGSIGAKLADPTSNIWALQLNVSAPQFFDGDLNAGSPEVGANAIFQPVLPIPLYGTGENQWKMIARPVIPIVFRAPVPTGNAADTNDGVTTFVTDGFGASAFDQFDAVAGIGDIELPLLLNPPGKMLGSWIFAAGPVFEFPSGSPNELGSNQYSIGPAMALGYKTKKWTAIVFPNYFFGVGSTSARNDAQPTTSKLAMLYSFQYNLPDAWQIGLAPTVTYNHNAPSGNQWNVPVGIMIGKTISVGQVPFKWSATFEYSVVSPDAFGQRAGFRLILTPVIPGLISNPIFGGD